MVIRESNATVISAGNCINSGSQNKRDYFYNVVSLLNRWLIRY